MAQGKKGKKKKEKGKTEEVVQAPKELTEAQIIKADRYFFDAQREKIAGNPQGAYDNFEAAVKINPNIDAAFYEMAQIIVRTGDFETATLYTQKALELKPDNKWYNEFYADLLSAQYKDEEAAAVFNKLRKTYPDSYEYYLAEIDFLASAGKYNDALKVLAEFEEKIGYNAEIANTRYSLHMISDNPDAAEKELVKLAESDPDNNDYQNMLADHYFQNREYDKAKDIYEKILENDPTDALAITSLANYYYENDDHEKYMYYSRKAFSDPSVNIDPKVGVLYSYISDMEADSSDFADAIELAELVKEAHPDDAKSYAVTGDLYNINENYTLALLNYEKSLEIRNDIFSVWQQVFFILSDEERYDDLIAKTNEAKELFPNQGILYYFNGVGYHQTDDYENAAKSYSKGAKMAFDNRPLQEQFYSSLGDVYNSLEDYENSDESFEKALKINPRSAYVLNNYSYYLSLRKDKLDEALEMSALSNEISPDNPSFLDTYAWILYQKGDYKKALEWQEKAIEHADGDRATLFEHYGDILLELDRKEEAINYWEKAIDAGGGDNASISQKINEHE
ncbi:MAG: tetratricopeptide repeat protein [Chitinophagales bacterium]